jgi:hypothetical protein
MKKSEKPKTDKPETTPTPPADAAPAAAVPPVVEPPIARPPAEEALALAEDLVRTSWAAFQQAEADLHTSAAYRTAKDRAKSNGENLRRLQEVTDKQRLPFFQSLLRLGIPDRTAADHKNLAKYWDQAKSFWDNHVETAPPGKTWDGLSIQDIIVMGRSTEWPERWAAKQSEAAAKAVERQGTRQVTQARVQAEADWRAEVNRLRALLEPRPLRRVPRSSPRSGSPTSPSLTVGWAPARCR